MEFIRSDPAHAVALARPEPEAPASTALFASSTDTLSRVQVSTWTLGGRRPDGSVTRTTL